MAALVSSLLVSESSLVLAQVSVSQVYQAFYKHLVMKHDEHLPHPGVGFEELEDLPHSVLSIFPSQDASQLVWSR